MQLVASDKLLHHPGLLCLANMPLSSWDCKLLEQLGGEAALRPIVGGAAFVPCAFHLTFREGSRL